MFTLFNLQLFRNRNTRHASQKRHLMRQLNIEQLGRRDLLAADLAGGLYDSSQVVVVEDVAQYQDTTDNYVVQIHGNDALKSTAISDATAGQHAVNDISSSFSLLASVRVHTEKAIMESSSGDRWAFRGRDLDSLAAADANHLLSSPGDNTVESRAITYTPIENVGGDSLDGRDVDDVMVGGTDDSYVHSGEVHHRLRQGAGVHSSFAELHVDTIPESVGDVVIGDGDDPDLIDGAADEALAVPEDDLELVALAAHGGGYGGYGGETPEISDFVGVPSPGDMWSFTGTVSDNDDPTGLTVTLSGLIDATITVADNDTFGVAVEVEEGAFGWVGVTVTDDDGNTSAVAWFLVDDGP